MKLLRWRVRTLVGLVVVAALIFAGFKHFQSRSDDPAGRIEALARLTRGRPLPTDAEATLIAALGDPVLRSTAIWGLVQIDSTSPKLLTALVGELESQTEQSRWAGRRDPYRFDPALGLKTMKLPPATIAPLLRRAMGSPEPWIRLQATEVLADAAGRPGPPSPVLAELLLKALRDAEAPIRVVAPEGLARLDGETRRQAVAILTGQLGDPGRPGQLVAAIGLARFDPEAAEAAAFLVDRLQEKDLAQRLADLYLLGRIGPPARSAVPSIVRAMTVPEAEKQVFWPADAFLPAQDSWHWVEMVRMLESGERQRAPGSLCAMGASVLERIGPEARRQAVEILAGMLRSEEQAQKYASIDALAAIGPSASAVIPALLAMAEREPAGRVWNGFSTIKRVTMALDRICSRDDPNYVACLVKLMDSPQWERRWAGASSLGHLEPPAPEAVPSLVKAVKDETQCVRFSAVEALGHYDGKQREAAIPPLLEALGDEDATIRFKAAEALAHLKAESDRVVGTLVGLLKSELPSSRYQAAELLGAMGPEARLALPVLKQMKEDPDSMVQEAVWRTLGVIDPVPVIKTDR